MVEQKRELLHMKYSSYAVDKYEIFTRFPCGQRWRAVNAGWLDERVLDSEAIIK